MTCATSSTKTKLFARRLHANAESEIRHTNSSSPRFGAGGPVTQAIAAIRNAAPAPTRRAMLTGAVALPLALPVAALAATVAPSPDAELIRLGAELDAAWAAEAPFAERMEALDTVEADEAWEAALGRTSDIAGKIAEATATTLAGLMVKARACSWCRDGEPFTDTTFDEQGTTDVSLAAGVMRDLLAMGGRV